MKYDNFEQLQININLVLGNLSFGLDSDKFEHSLDIVGNLLRI